MLSWLSASLGTPVWLGLLVLMWLLMGLLLWAAVRSTDEDSPQAPASASARVEAVQRSFRRATRLIEQGLVSHAARYRLPWVVVVCDALPQARLPLLDSGMPGALSADAARTASVPGLEWDFLVQGVVAHLPSAPLQGATAQTPEQTQAQAQDAQDRRQWDAFLGLCGQYRPERPLDAVVLAVPVMDFLLPDAPLRLARRAQTLHKMLWLAQNRLAMQFPVYLVITGCEVLEGFTELVAQLPDALRASMLGWSSPHELGQPFQLRWVDSSLNEIMAQVQDLSAEVGAQAMPGQDTAGGFLLPSGIDRLRPGLRPFLDELLAPSVYHEPVLFRGYYLTGEMTLPALAAPRPAGPDLPTDLLQDMVPDIPSDMPPDRPPNFSGEDFGGSAGQLPLPPADTPGVLPVFLRDIFGHKVFAERGLVRLSSERHASAMPLERYALAGVWALALAWLLGLGWSGVLLARTRSDILRVMVQMEQGLPGDAPMAGASVRTQRARDRDNVIQSLGLLEQVKSATMWSVFMPGSWQWVDDLQPQLQKWLERGFVGHAIEPLRRVAHEEISLLTGVPLDPGTGLLLPTASCRLPQGWAQTVAARTSPGLNVEDQPEFEALLHYVARLEQIDAGITALDRLLSGNSSAVGADLRQAVSQLLQTELSGSPKADYLARQSTQRPPLRLGLMRQATTCSWQLGVVALQERLFEQNPLLRSELSLSDLALDLSNQREWQGQLASWREMSAVMQQQTLLTQPGKGEWMHARAFEPGPAYEGMLQRVQGLRLIGPEPVQAMRQDAGAAFETFRTNWQEVLVQAGGLLDSSLLWDDKQRRWVFDDDRSALRDALARLLVHPMLRGHVLAQALPKVPATASLGWDVRELDEALAVADQRKKLLGDVLATAPLAQRTPLQTMVNGVFANRLVGHLSDALSYTTRGVRAAAVTEAERSRLVRLLGLLQELGASTAATQLSYLLGRDVLSRLAVLDDAFNQAQLFWPGEAQIRKWQGDSASLLAIWDAADASAMAAHVAQQVAFADNSAHTAEVLLTTLDGMNLSEPLVERWRQLVRVLAAYRLKTPGNSLAALEQFLLTGVAEINTGNCLSKLGSVPARRGQDLFAQRLATLQTSLLARCKTLHAGQQQAGWDRMAGIFNSSLAGRLPFQGAARGGPERPAALPDDVARWLRAYEPVRAAWAGGVAGSAAVRRADEALMRARQFLAPLFTADDAPAGLDVGVEFRAQTVAEIEGNKVIEWTLRVGNDTLGWRDPPRPLRWLPGVPVSLSLRVARDSPLVPRPDPGQAQMVVDDRTVVWRWRDPWALLSMVSALREGPVGQRDDPRTQLLRLEFPLAPLNSAPNTTSATTPATASPNAGGQERARVYIRLSLSAPGQRQPLPWPGPMPARVPEWN